MHIPAHYHFKDQEPDEQILDVIHRHWFDIFVQYLPVILIMIFLVFASGFLTFVAPDFMDENMLVYLFILTLLGIALWIFSAAIWVDYYLDVWILTNKRVVNVEQRGLFIRHVSELRYQKIQDVTTEVKGIIATLLNFGEIYIQTAGEQNRFLFHNVPAPYKIKMKIMELQKREHQKDMGELESLLKDTHA